MIRTVTATEKEFWEKLEGFTPTRSIFDAQGDDHPEIDLRLVEKIEEYLVPKIGNWEQSDRWFHNIDFYGDGIRSLDFSVSYFVPAFVQDFQCMLIGEHSDFTILCKVQTDLYEEDSRIGSIAVRSDRIIVSYPLVEYLDGQV